MQDAKEGKKMLTRRSFVTGFGALLGLALGVATLSAAGGGIEYLTFSGPVSLPGVSLGAGSYSFEVLDLQGSATVISVRNRATRLPVYLGMTQRVERAGGRGTERVVVLGESSHGMAPPILAWYPEGGTLGHQFIYRKP
jgi:hypothetical protein